VCQYQSSGVSHNENSERMNGTRASFVSLPNELRNIIYASSLKCTNPISVAYDAATKSLRNPWTKRASDRTPLEALKLLSGLDHTINGEARSYFFANHIF
jgi:hypothetical protein